MTRPVILENLRSTESTLFLPGTDGEDLLIVFSSRPAGLNRANFFSYDKSLLDVKPDRLLLRDPEGQWFLRGLPGVTQSFDETMALLSEIITGANYSRVIIAGLSAGTLAALHAGAQLPVDAVVCIGCRSTQTPEARARDARKGGAVRDSLEALWEAIGPDHPLLDVAPILCAPGARQTPVHLYYDPEFPRDARSAKTLTHLPFVKSFHFPGTGHDVHEMTDALFTQDPVLAGTARILRDHDKPDYRAGGLARGLAAARDRTAAKVDP